MSIEIRNVTKTYGKQKALDQVSLSISEGEIIGLLGPNGAGKSTLMKIISCFLPPTSGEVSVNGADIFGQSLEVRKKVGYLPENNPLYTDLYIREYLQFVAEVYGLGKQAKERVEEMIQLTGLTAEKGKKIGALSRGYRQRVGLAQALIHDPEVLILDEPTSGLDPNQLLEIRELIRQLGRKKTVMLSTHIMQEVEAVCSRAVIIDKGKIVADDKTEVLSSLASDFQAVEVEFSEAVSTEAISSIEGVLNAEKLEGNVWIVRSGTGDKDIRDQVFHFAVDQGISVLSMKKKGRSLEEVFQRLTLTESKPRDTEG